MLLNDATFWFLICSIGIMTFLLRYSFVYIFGRVNIPNFVKEILPFIPAAALSAIVAPQVISVPIIAHLTYSPKLVAWLAAMFVAWRTKNIFLTISSGLILLVVINR